jgi:hypothetical protein
MARRNNPNQARHHEWHTSDGEVYELVDLPHHATIIKMPTAADRKRAKPRNPNACALARCASREADGLPAQIGADKAYIPVFIDGKQIVYRCQIPAETRRAIRHFDETGKFPRGGFRFVGIAPSATLNGQRAAQKRHRERWGSMRGVTGRENELSLRNASRRALVIIRPEES